MKQVKEMVEKLLEKLEALARDNAVVAKPVSMGDRHVVPLCELGMGFGGGGGSGEGGCEEGKDNTGSAPHGKGEGGGGGGGAKVSPVAVFIVDGDKYRLESFGN